MARCRQCGKIMLKRGIRSYCNNCAIKKIWELEDSCTEWEIRCDTLEKRVKNAEFAYTHSETTRKVLAQRVNEMECSNKSLKEEKEVLQSEKEKYENLSKEKEEELEHVVQERTELLSEKQQYIKKMEDAEENAAQLSSKINEIEQEKAEMQKEIEKLKEGLAKDNDKTKQVAQAELMFGMAFEYGFGNVTADTAISFQWFKRAAEKGNARAAGLVAIDYFSGDGVEKDINKADEWSQKAAKQGDKAGIVIQGQIAESKGENVIAYQHYMRAAKLGDYNGMNNVGSFLLAGKGTTKNPTMAAEWNLKAAVAGSATAAWNLAGQYAMGDGVQKNEEGMMQFMRLAAKLGHPRAVYLASTIGL